MWQHRRTLYLPYPRTHHTLSPLSPPLGPWFHFPTTPHLPSRFAGRSSPVESGHLQRLPTLQTTAQEPTPSPLPIPQGGISVPLPISNPNSSDAGHGGGGWSRRSWGRRARKPSDARLLPARPRPGRRRDGLALALCSWRTRGVHEAAPGRHLPQQHLRRPAHDGDDEPLLRQLPAGTAPPSLPHEAAGGAEADGDGVSPSGSSGRGEDGDAARYEGRRDMLYNQTHNLDLVAFASEGIKDAQQTMTAMKAANKELKGMMKTANKELKGMTENIDVCSILLFTKFFMFPGYFADTKRFEGYNIPSLASPATTGSYAAVRRFLLSAAGSSPRHQQGAVAVTAKMTRGCGDDNDINKVMWRRQRHRHGAAVLVTTSRWPNQFLQFFFVHEILTYAKENIHVFQINRNII